MPIGSIDGYYTSGSLYKRFYGTTGKFLNKRAVAAFDAQFSAAGTAIFSQVSAASEQKSVLTVQQVQDRLVKAQQAKTADRLDLFA